MGYVEKVVEMSHGRETWHGNGQIEGEAHEAIQALDTTNLNIIQIKRTPSLQEPDSSCPLIYRCSYR